MRGEEDEALRLVASDLARADQLAPVLRRIPELTLAAVPANGSALERVDFDANEVEVIATSGEVAPKVGSRVPYPGSLAEEVLSRNEPEIVLAGDLLRRPIAGMIPESCRRCNALVVPLVSEGEAVGALILLRFAEEPPFTDEEAHRMRILGDMAAMALRRVLLQEQVERSRDALEESDRRFRYLVESVRDYAIYMLDVAGRVVSWNAGAERIKGYREEEVLGRHFSIFYRPEERERQHPEEELTIAAAEGAYEEEGWRLRKDGSLFWAYVTITAIRDADGTLVGYAKVTRDLTERKRAEGDRERLLAREHAARVEAEGANRLKGDILANMSHELRTPLNAIVGYTDLLDAEIAGPLSPTQRTYLHRIRAGSHHLQKLVGDVLDMARIEAGHLAVEVHPVRAEEVVAAAMAMVQPQAEAKELHLHTACSSDGVALLADPARLRQVLLNLFANAVKFTEPGGSITVTCGETEEPSHGAELAGDGPWGLIRVQDTGVGIPAHRITGIWRPFEQAESGHARPKEGAGLGLAISRSLARLMGGDLVAFSEVGSGSTFLLFLPAVPLERVEEEALEERRGPERRTPGISAVSEAALAEIQRILNGYLARLRTDPAIPHAWEMSEAALEDHAATLLVDIAQALNAVEEAAGASSAVVRDSEAIQRTLAERHGRRRADAGWGPGEVRRDYQILREELERAVRRRARPMVAPDTGDWLGVEHGLALFARFIERAERTSLAELGEH